MRIKAFGMSREIVGAPEIEFALEGGKIRVDALRERILAKYPELREIKSLAIAVNMEEAEEGQPVDPLDEVALIPPVSGG